MVFADTGSPDSHYALGWTIRPRTKDVSPVDWSKYKEEDIRNADLDYPWGTQDDQDAQKPPYVLTDGIVDLIEKSFHELPFESPISAHHNHQDIQALWPNEQKVIVILDGRFWTSELLLVHLSPDGPTINLIKKAAPEVEKVIAAKRPLASNMEVTYNGEDEPIASDGTIRLAFSVVHPKGSFEDFDGHLHVSLKDGKPLKAESDTTADQPFVGELGVADKHLNEVYGKLRMLLGGDDLNHLVADQNQWIVSRNTESRELADEKVPYFKEGSTLEAYREIRNRQALKLTRERTAALQKQLDAAASN